MLNFTWLDFTWKVKLSNGPMEISFLVGFSGLRPSDETFGQGPMGRLTNESDLHQFFTSWIKLDLEFGKCSRRLKINCRTFRCSWSSLFSLHGLKAFRRLEVLLLLTSEFSFELWSNQYMLHLLTLYQWITISWYQRPIPEDQRRWNQCEEAQCFDLLPQPFEQFIYLLKI